MGRSAERISQPLRGTYPRSRLFDDHPSFSTITPTTLHHNTHEELETHQLRKKPHPFALSLSLLLLAQLLSVQSVIFGHPLSYNDQDESGVVRFVISLDKIHWFVHVG